MRPGADWLDWPKRPCKPALSLPYVPTSLPTTLLLRVPCPLSDPPPPFVYASGENEYGPCVMHGEDGGWDAHPVIKVLPEVCVP